MSLIPGNDDANNDDADTLFVVRNDVLNGLCTYSDDSDCWNTTMVILYVWRVPFIGVLSETVQVVW